MITRLASRVFILTVIGMWSGVSFASAYSINQTVGAGTVIGTITTDGTIGEILLANVTDWNFDVAIGAFATTFNTSNSDFNVLGVDGSGLIATIGDLSFDASSTGSRAFGFQQNTGAFASWALCNAGADLGGFPCTLGIASEWLYDGDEFSTPISIERSGQIGVGTAAVVPVPAAAWLFGSALGLMGVMRRKLTG